MATATASPAPDWEPRSIEDREERIKQIDVRLSELDAEYVDSQMPDEAREEWNQLNGERDQHGSTVNELRQRRERLRKLASNPAATEQVNVGGAAERVGVPAYVPYHGDDIYDVQRIRTASRSEEDYRSRLHDNARRAIERAVYPGPAGGKEQVQEHVEQLLARVDDRSGTFAKRILATGSPIYDRAFGKVVMGGVHTLSADEQRAMSVGTPADGGFAVPFQLDPTVILTSDGAISPLRQIARVEQITSKTWQGITSQGISVSRSAEAAPATGNEFTIGQPEVSPTRVIADVRFSVELDQDWSQLRNEIARLLGDAKQVEEDTAFVTGDGTGNNPSGVVATLNSSSEVPTGGLSSFSIDDLDLLEAALPPRFRGRASYLANKAVYQAARAAARAESGFATDRWVSLTQGMPATLDGYPAYEATEMESDTTAASRVAVFGDFSQFLIVDRLGMNLELNPHIVDSNGRWTGQRAVVAVWRNSSKVLVDNAFRVLTGHAA